MGILLLNSARNADIPYDAWLKETGEELYLLCSTKQAETSTAYSFVKKFDNYESNGCVEATALELFEERGYRTVVAKAEADLLRAGKLRDMLGIEGQSWQSALAYRDKVVMKSYTQKAGIPTPAFARLETFLDLLAFVKHYGYPVFIKPVGGSGAIDTCLLSNRASLEGYLEGGLASNMEVEQYIEGDMYHVDGLVLEGDIIFMHPSKYTNGGCLAYKQDRSCGSYLLSDQNPLKDRLNRFTERIINALPSPQDFTFHAEIFHTPDDVLVFCEIASRTGGARISETIRRALQVNIDQLWVQGQCGLRPHAGKIRASVTKQKGLAGWLVMPPKNGTLSRLPDTAPVWVLDYEQNALPGVSYAGKTYSRRKAGDYVASVIVGGATEVEVQARLKQAEDWLEEEVRWSGLA
jgi:hypothetical protein